MNNDSREAQYLRVNLMSEDQLRYELIKAYAEIDNLRSLMNKAERDLIFAAAAVAEANAKVKYFEDLVTITMPTGSTIANEMNITLSE